MTLVLLCCLLLILKYTPASHVIHNIQYQFTNLGTGLNTIFNRIFTNEESLRSQSEKYKSIAYERIQNEIYIIELEKNINELESALEYSEKIEFRTIGARILSKSDQGGQYLIIDRGSNDQVMINMPVTIEQGHLIGTVAEVYKYTSLIRLLEDEQSSIPAMILSDSMTNGLIFGQNGYLYKMQFIPQEKNIKALDTVITSGLDNNIPSGLIIGVINEVIKDETAPFQEALVEPIYDISQYSNVLIIDTSNTKYEE